VRSRTRNPFSTVKTAGLLLPIDLLARIADGDPGLPGLTSESYHLDAGDRLNEAAARAWNECSAAWKRLRQELEKLPASDAGTTLTRERWLLPLFKELGYGRLQPQKAIPIEDKTYPISHAWGGHIPIHLVSCKLELDKRTPGAAGAAARSPYSLVQELLNRSAQHRWGFLSNGRMLYVLRDNVSLTRAANVEFDLEAMFDGDVFADFKLLFLLCHESRVEFPSDGKPEDCWLEKWSKLADDQGTRAREKLRDGVESAIKALGAGFLTTRGNTALRDRLRSGKLATQDYYRQLLRMVYRLLLLLVAEEKKDENGRNLLHPPGTPDQVRQRYAQYYSVGHLRTLAGKRRGTTHTDLYESLKLLFLKLRTGYEPLGIPGLGSFLFSLTATPDLDSAPLSNEALLEAIRALCITEDTSGRGGAVRRPVDFANLGSDELGSVYESLLELHPKIETDEGPFSLGTAAGHERKTTGSYYTPTSLINCLLDSALEPVAKESLNKPTLAEAEKALLSLKVCDPACGSGHFLIAAAERLAKHLASLRTGDEEPSTLAIQHAKRDIIGRCIYGVDMNPMAVELCKVSLWMEAIEPGKPLSFLDHHIRIGNSLLGTTPELIAAGIPDEAFTAIEGDEKKACTALKKRNKAEMTGLGGLFAQQEAEAQALLQQAAAALEELPDNRPEDIEAKERAFRRQEDTEEFQQKKQLADTWCAAFVIPKKLREPGRDSSARGITVGLLNELAGGQPLPTDLISEVSRLLGQYQFFHWHLAFPEVFARGGFDCIIGNPPWDTLSPDQREFFGNWVGGLRSMAPEEQQGEIDRLLVDDVITLQWAAHCRHLFAFVHFLKNSGVYTLYAPGNLGKGDFNIYRMFVETAVRRVRPGGFTAQIVPAGLYGGANASAIRKFLFDDNCLTFLAGCENKSAVFFPGVHPQTWFALYAVQRGGRTDKFRVTFGVDTVEKVMRARTDSIELEADAIRQLAPETYAIPDVRDLNQLTTGRKMYAACPTFGDRAAGPPFRHYSAELHMGNNRGLFTTDPAGLPVYEGRMIDHFDHRAKTYESGHGNSAVWIEREFGDPAKGVVPQWRVLQKNIPSKLGDRCDQFRLGFGDVANPRNERSFIATIIPPGTICGHTVPTIVFEAAHEWGYLPWLAVANTFTMDALVRSKLSSPHMTYTVVDSLPFPRPAITDAFMQWAAPIVLRLVCTSPEMTPFWNRMAELGLVERAPEGTIPHRALVNPIDRALAKADLEAYVAGEVFGLTLQELSDLLDTFDVLQRREQQNHGEFRTKRLILEAYNGVKAATKAGQPYQSPLNQRPVASAQGPDGWSLAKLADGKIPDSPFTLVVNEQEVGKTLPKQWRCLSATTGDGLPDAETWVLVRHPNLKRGNAAIPVALGKLTYQELTDASTKKKVMVVTLRGPVPPAQVRIPLSEWPAFRPLAVLEPLDS